MSLAASSRSCARWASSLLLAAGVALGLSGCGGASNSGSSTTPTPTPTPTPTYVVPSMAPSSSPTLSLIHDPAIVYQSGSYYALSTDPGGSSQVGYIPIYKSADKLTWTRVGQVFGSVPSFVSTYFAPNAFKVFWAPDVSYFNGLYHVYYAASGFGLNYSLIGLATSPTMNPSDANYAWTSQGMVLASVTTDNFNAIDPSILVDTDAGGNLTHVWMQYGSFWGGIYQREINPATGLLSTTNTAVTNLATRPSVTRRSRSKGPNLVKRNGYYYLFVSLDSCCASNPASSNYKIAVGRSTSAQGPFLDMNGTSMLNAAAGRFCCRGMERRGMLPGGLTALIGAPGGDVIAYHALNLAQNGLDYLFVNYAYVDFG